MPGTKNRLLFLLQYLLEHTDDAHTISADKLMKIYEDNGFKGSRNTIRDDIAALNEAGFEIAGDIRHGKRVYYVIDRRFELSELKMLVDAMSSCRFITKTKSEALIEKLTMMTNEANRPSLTAKVFTTDRIKTSNPTVSQTMDKIRIAIDERKKISFHYIDYTPEKKRILRRGGQFPYGRPFRRKLCYNSPLAIRFRKMRTSASPVVACHRISFVHSTSCQLFPSAFFIIFKVVSCPRLLRLMLSFSFNSSF